MAIERILSGTAPVSLIPVFGTLIGCSGTIFCVPQNGYSTLSPCLILLVDVSSLGRVSSITLTKCSGINELTLILIFAFSSDGCDLFLDVSKLYYGRIVSLLSEFFPNVFVGRHDFTRWLITCTLVVVHVDGDSVFKNNLDKFSTPS